MENVLLTFRKHPVEIILIITSIIITSIIAFLQINTSNNPQVLVESAPPIEAKSPEPTTFTIDISGAVMKPNVYKVDNNSTLDDVIKKAGGFSPEAATDFIGRNFNLAKGVTDKEKIYIPSKEDIAKGLFDESNVVLVEEKQEAASTSENEEINTGGISINTASLEELDTLSGVGPVTAQKIIDNRPYDSLDDLVTKKSINSTTFSKIKDLISL